MKKYLLLACCVFAVTLAAQKQSGKVIPKVTSITLNQGAVTAIHLSPGYTTSIKVPEEVSSVMVGDPASFKVEHSEVEPRLVFIKPITAQPAQSNALITTKSGQEISLQLISDHKNGASGKVDFVLEYGRPRSFLIRADSPSAFDIPPAQNASAGASRNGSNRGTLDAAEAQLLKETELASLDWTGNELQLALGEDMADGRSSVLAFSVFNHSTRPIELLPPQIELYGTAKHKGVKAEPIAIGEYRITADRLEPGERADGVVVFERPEYKESNERLVLQMATVDAANRPLMVPIPFVAPVEGGK